MTFKIFSGYETTTEPWGGANNFLRALYHQLEVGHGIEITFDASADCDVFFFCQTGRGAGKSGGKYTPSEIKSIAALNPSAPIITRLVNTRKHSNHDHFWTYLLNGKDRKIDKNTLGCAAISDTIIFQSNYQKKFFQAQGCDPALSVVIPNGSAQYFSDFSEDISKMAENKPVRVLATSVSTKSFKRHAIVSQLASLKGVEVLFAGTWPEHEPLGQVKALGKLTHADIIEVAKNCHYFFHPSFKEVCSNSIVEALSMGLPVLYVEGKGGNAELVNGYGLCIPRWFDQDIITVMREKHSAVQTALQPARINYGMGRAAQEYVDFFKKSIALKSGNFTGGRSKDVLSQF